MGLKICNALKDNHLGLAAEAAEQKVTQKH